MTGTENDRMLAEHMRRRDEDDKQIIEERGKYPCCGLFPSPESISFGSSSGSDGTNTYEDYLETLQWLESCKFKNVGHFKYPADQPAGLEQPQYNAVVTNAFNLPYAAIGNANKLPDLDQLEELVFWYYTGHGLDKDEASKLLYSATPCLNNNKHNKRVKGGELCLHSFGFCGLDGLLQPWIKAVGSEKHNKHLVVVLDSCHSGVFVEDLNQIQYKDTSWYKNNCTITVQAACGENEKVQGRYFTPTFLYLNKHNDELERLKQEWSNLDDETKQAYRDAKLPSPVVASTAAGDTADPTLKIEHQGFSVTLFRDGGFFKFCYDSVALEYKLVKTIASQAHLCPLPHHARPVYWSYDNALRIYPVPDLMILADKYHSYVQSTTLNCSCLNPGSFSRNDYSFKVYWPATREVEESKIQE